MPNVDLADIQGKTTQHPKLAEAQAEVIDDVTARITIEVPVLYARKIKVAAAMRGMTVKRLVMDALDAQYPNL